ncbi:MAG TPA: M28 family peptidase [Polyangiaceae bacterium]|nr:M28 family peptidase [Polyangiaceae bacterium]
MIAIPPPFIAPTRTSLRVLTLTVFTFAFQACGSPPEAAPPAAVAPPASSARSPEPPIVEPHLSQLRQLTFQGENAEAYWSWSGKALTLQSKLPGQGCDRIRRADLTQNPPTFTPISDGKGATTCSFFFPGDAEVLYASTELAGPACPPLPDRSNGYVWALYDSYEIFKANADGSNVTRLTDSKGYDAEATICGVDGSIVFTSVRDGDIDLYRMDRDGGNVRRLTSTPGYDGGAFFNKDCSKIVWRASRPKTTQELADYQRLLGQGLVRPTKLELYVADADGSNAMQLTYLDAASWAPYWHPSQHRILFSSNYGDPNGREFDIWSIDDTGTRLERITRTPGFDAFPMFSPDGTTLAFSSNRNTPAGSYDTHVFTAQWTEGLVAPELELPADRVLTDIRFLADPKQEGRGIGSKGLANSGEYLEQQLDKLGVAPAADHGFRDRFLVPTALEQGPKTQVKIGKAELKAEDFVPLGFSAQNGAASGALVLAGYGVSDNGLGVDDYKGLDVKGRIAVVRRFVSEDAKFESTEAKRRFGDLRYKTWIAKEHGAAGLIIVDDPLPPVPTPKGWKAPDEASLPVLSAEGYGNAGLPVVMLKRSVGHALLQKLSHGQKILGSLTLDLHTLTEETFNVVGRIAASVPNEQKLPGAIVVGAHYDHLGMGGRYSLAPDSKEPHVGADDNASGTASLLEIARNVVASQKELRRDVIVIAFSGEEMGLLGSSHFVHAMEDKTSATLGPKGVFAMINLDMVGRMRENRVQVLGTQSATEWASLVTPACDGALINCDLVADGGYGPSDQMSFFTAGIPVLHFFTGAHSDYHKPSDTPDKINAAGAGQIAKAVSNVVLSLARLDKPLGFNGGAKGPPPRGDVRNFNASLGTIPDYAGPGPGKSGVLLAGVRPGGAAALAGLQRGDLLVAIGEREIQSIEDFMFVLNASKPNQTTTVTVVRDGKRVDFPVTFQDGGRR